MVLSIYRALIFVMVTLTVVFIASCSSGGSPTGNGNQLVVQASLKQLGLGSSVTVVELRVTGEAGYEEVQQGNFVDGIVTFALDDVPTGQQITFTMSALDGEGTVLYSGEFVDEIAPGTNPVIEILMLPRVPMIRVTPLYSQLGNGVELAQVSVEIHNVDSLFGVSFRLEYDPGIVSVSGVAEGPIFDPNQTIFFAREEADYVAVGLTIQGSQTPQGVNGGGTVASLDFVPGGSFGTSELTINPETVSLVDWRGNELPLAELLYIENGEVEVVAQ